MTPRLLVRILCLSAFVGASLLVAVPAASLAATTPTFDITVGNCWRGKVPDEHAQVHVTWKDSAGHLIDSFDVESQEYGYWSFLDTDNTCATRPVRGGDRLTERETDMGLYKRAFVVKAMSGTFDRKTNFVSGHAPPNSSMYLSVFKDILAPYSGPQTCNEVTLTTTGTGTFSRNTATCQAGYDAAGGDTAWISWSSPVGDRETLILTVPYLQVVFGTSRVNGFAFAATHVALTLKKHDGTIRAHAQSTSTVNGNWQAKFRNKNGQLAKPNITDMVSGDWVRGNASFQVFGMTTEKGFGNNTLRGSCAPRTLFSIIVTYASGPGVSIDTGTTNSTGGTGDWPVDNHTLASGDQIQFTCARPSGDRERQITIQP